MQAVFCCLESCIKSAKIPVLAADFFVAIWEGAASLLPLGKMQDLNLKLLVWRGFVFIREDLVVKLWVKAVISHFCHLYLECDS